eukprot:TRINITY_DN93977_c0_g1_i1.p1 TRINITY_DN93977_c0_g1~~TRINITY_DN93977_c0_g1_i1.p1  ORF type:complete len:815 (-),score=177.41 TRINITY_DN93977_c0_g1_i1:129-2432(-)
MDHIDKGLEETRATRDDVGRVELLAAKMKVETLSGKLLELRGDRHLGAVPAAECCLAVASRNLPVPTPSAVYARMVLYMLLDQNPCLVKLRRTETSAEALEASGGAEEQNMDPNELLLLEAKGLIVVSPIAQDFKKQEKKAKEAKPEASEDYRARQLVFADMIAQCILDLDRLLEVQGFKLTPYNLNCMLDFEASEERGQVGVKPADAPLLPKANPNFRDQVQSDSRAPPNTYLELMPLRLHCELILIALRLELGEMDEAERLLKEAERRMARCVHLLPWLHVQFCMLKLRWRRLSYKLGLAIKSAPPDAPNDILFRDPKTFSNGICPPTDSPLYRTFLNKVRVPFLTHDQEWVPPAERGDEDGLTGYLKELLGVVRAAVREGGHDCKHILSLLREGLEEVLRVEALLLVDTARSPGFNQMFALFSCFTAVSGCRRALLFTESETKAATGPAAVDSEKLPLRVALDLQRHLHRQAVEGGLAYSAAALEAAKKSMMFRSVMRHSLALRRESDLFSGIFHDERRLCDQLHTTMMQASEAYNKERIIDDSLLVQALEPPEGGPSQAPTEGDVHVLWMRPDLTAAAVSESPSDAAPLHECYDLLAFVCASVPADTEDADPVECRPLVARFRNVSRMSLRRLSDELAADLEHCLPAIAVTAKHVEQRVREVTCALRGPPSSSAGAEAPGNDARLDASLKALLKTLVGDQATDNADGGGDKDIELLESAAVQVLLKALIQLLDPTLGAAKASHPELGRFLRSVLAPGEIFPKR